MQSFTSRILSHKSLCPLVSDQHRSNWKENKFGTKFHRGGGGGGGGLNNKETDGTEKLVRGVGGGRGSEEWTKNREQQCRNKVTNHRFIL